MSDTNKHKIDSRITSVNRKASREWNNKFHAEDGVHFLTDTNPSPNGYYYGFYVIANTVVSAITHIDASKNGGENGITSVTTFPAGAFISLPGGFTNITLTSGEIQLLKYNPYK